MPSTEHSGVAALRDILRLPTVAAPAGGETEPAPFLELHRALRHHFPLTHEIGEVIDVPPHGLLIRIPSDPTARRGGLPRRGPVVPHVAGLLG